MQRNISDPHSVLNPHFLAFYHPLHEKFTPWQQRLNQKRQAVMAKGGYKPDDHFPDPVKNFRITLPQWCQDQRNQMTGPADDAALIVKMMNSGAPGVMVDFEDSLANTWEKVALGHNNMTKLFGGGLTYDKDGVKVGLNSRHPTVLWIRPRGLHMTQELRFPASLQNVRTSASLFDVCMAAYYYNSDKLPCKGQPLAYYIPKSETSEEAIWWEELFKDIAKARKWAPDFIKCMALVESYSLAHQLPMFVYNLRDHLLGLNLGRWDYMASLIEHNLINSDWAMPDRNSIPHDIEFFQNLRKYMVNLCHHHGMLAIGGMTALFPNRKDPELNERALTSLQRDKANEAAMGMDGAWTGHPDQNQIAVEQFPGPNQLGFMHDDLNLKEYRPNFKLTHAQMLTMSRLPISVEGTKQAIRAAIRYRNGVLNGKGASLLDGYMEDLATDRICRLLIAQRMIKLPSHDDTSITRWFDEMLSQLIEEGAEIGSEETLREARTLTEYYIITGTQIPE